MQTGTPMRDPFERSVPRPAGSTGTPTGTNARAIAWTSVRKSPQVLVRMVAVLLVGLAIGLTPGYALASDHWSQPARGLRLLHRHTRHTDGTPLDLFAVVADLCDPAVELRATAPSEAGQTVSAWARQVGATAAVNGDYFDGAHMRPLGPARGHGQWWPEGPREHRDALLLANAGGQVSVLDAPDDAAAGAGVLWQDAAARVGAEWTEVVGVRERIVLHGAVHLSGRIRHDEDRRHPRTGIGLSADGHTLILLVVNGRSESSSGATAQELGELLLGLGAWEGMKLDGGGSSTLFVAGRGVLNHPSDGRERHVANQFGIVVRADAPAGPRAFCSAAATPAVSGREMPPGAPALQTLPAASVAPRPGRSPPERAARLARQPPHVARHASSESGAPERRERTATRGLARGSLPAHPARWSGTCGPDQRLTQRAVCIRDDGGPLESSPGCGAAHRDARGRDRLAHRTDAHSVDPARRTLKGIAESA